MSVKAAVMIVVPIPLDAYYGQGSPTKFKLLNPQDVPKPQGEGEPQGSLMTD